MAVYSEDAEVAEEPPQDEKDEHRAETATAQLLGTISRGDTA
jgi:hypothetical protein